MAKISSVVLDALSNCKVSDGLLFIGGRLDRKVYTGLNKVLGMLGGKWNSKQGAHVFASDPSDAIDSAIATGEYVDIKKELQFFPTPAKIVKLMLEKADIRDDDSVLEPSAGDGAIVDHISNPERITCVEIYAPCAETLRLKGYKTVCCDFLKFANGRFDRIIMNPPFSKQQDIDHVLHAFVDLLKEGGILVSIVSESCFFRSNAKAVNFRAFLENENAEIIDLNSGDFKVSGTMVKTRIIVLKK